MARLPAVEDEETLCLRLLEEHGVAVHPGLFFGFSSGVHLVLSLLPPEGIFSEGVRRLLAATHE